MDNLKNTFLQLFGDRRIVVLVGAGLLLVVVLFILSATLFNQKFGDPSGKRGKGTDAKKSQATSPDLKKLQETKPGRMSIKLKDGRSSFKVGETITFFLSIDSAGIPVVGFDGAVSFNSGLVSFQNQKNLLKDYKHFRRATNEWVLLTAVRDIDKKASKFDGTSVMEFSFKAEKEGNTIFNLSLVPGSFQDSNLVNEASEDILGDVTGVGVRITN
jgi:hypothetical protein